MNNEDLRTIITCHRELLDLIRCNRADVKTELAKKLNISFPTLVKQLDELRDNNVLTEDSKIELNPKLFYLCGISIGGAQCKVTFIDSRYNVLRKEEFEALREKYQLFQNDFFSQNPNNTENGYLYFNTPDNETDLKLNLNAIIKDVIKLHDSDGVPPVLGIGIAVTGSVDAEKQIVLSSHNVGYLKNASRDRLISPDSLQTLKQKKIPVIIDHNAKALAVCEKFSLYQYDNVNNEYSDIKNIASLYLGSGIGCGLILDNRLIRGCRNLNGELGHVQVPRYLEEKEEEKISEDRLCSCGAQHCLENYIIRDVFEKDRKAFKQMTSGDIKNYLNDLGPQKDIKLKMLGYYVGWAIDLLTKLLNVELIIFSGKMTCFMEELWQYITPVSGDSNGATLDCKMIISKYGALAPTIGAAILSSYPENYSIQWFN